SSATMPIACAYACSLSPVASSRCAAFVAVPLSSARHAPGRLRGRYSSHRRAASSANGRAASSRCWPSSETRSDLAAVRIWSASESALIIPVYQPSTAVTAVMTASPVLLDTMTTPSWDDAYATSTPAAWDIGRPQPAFARLAEQGLLAGRVLDSGCGTGEQT